MKPTLFVLSVLLCCICVGADFTSIERQRRADQVEFEAASGRVAGLNFQPESSTYLASILREADVWAGRNPEYRASLLMSAYARFNTPISSRVVAGTNMAFIESLIVPEIPKLPADRAMLTLSALWNSLVVQAPEESAPMWESRRKQNLELWLRTVEAAAAQFKPEMVGQGVSFNVRPPEGSTLTSSGSDPEFEPNPILREKYFEMTHRNHLSNVEINKAREISEGLPRFEKRAESLAVMLYSRPPYSLVELQEILDRRVSDERATNIMNAVYRALPKAVAATLPRPIPHAAKASVNPAATGTAHSGLPAIARPSKLRDRINAGGSQGVMGAVSSGAAVSGAEPGGSGGGAAGGRAVWPWVLLGLVGAAGAWVWLRLRRS